MEERKLYPNLKLFLPQLAEFWHPTKNGDLRPEDVQPYSNKRVWWYCSVCDESWTDKISTRSKNGGKGCPFCAGKRAGKRSSLAYFFPDLAKEWHIKKMESLRLTK